MTTFSIKRGTDFYVNFTLREPRVDCDTPGDPVDVTGYTAAFTVTIGADVTTVTSPSGITITAVDGKFAVHLDNTQTALFDRSGTWGMTVVSPGGDITSLGDGNFRVR